MARTLSLPEFADLAAAAVEAAELEAPSSRVRVVPGERMLRYYVTQGLMDRPEVVTTAAGREARYGRRHLLQFLAVKRLQAGGASLAEIRAELARADADRLAQLAALPAGVVPRGLEDTAPDRAGLQPADRAGFWRQAPEEAPTDQPPARHARATATPRRTVTVVTVAPGAELHLDAARWARPDITRLSAAVARALAAFAPASDDLPPPANPDRHKEPR